MNELHDAVYIPHDCDRTDELREQLVAIERDASRYRWLRVNPAFETEALLRGLTPEQFDALVDERLREDIRT